MHLLDKGTNKQALEYAALLEQYASHPIAEPIANAYSDNNNKVQDFQTFPTGITGIIDDHRIFAGQPEWIGRKEFYISDVQWDKVEKSREKGHVPVAVAWDKQVQSILVVGDQLRTEAGELVSALKKEGKKVAIITGDSQLAGEAIQKQLQPDFLFTETQPDSKSNIIRELKKIGRVAMIGDGSNDAPALAQADLGVAFGNPTAIAAESAHIVIPNDRLQLIPAAFKAIRLTKSRIHQNLGWAFLYNIITIPLAIAGAINPLFAAAAMATSSLLVVSNSSRDMDLADN
jgi:Cu2+-exporting ATPase